MNQTPTPFEARIARIAARRALFGTNSAPSEQQAPPPSLPERRRRKADTSAPLNVRTLWQRLKGG